MMYNHCNACTTDDMCSFFVVYTCMSVHIAAQMLLLAKLLPLAIGDHVPTDDDRWMNYLRMCEIISYLFYPHIAEDDAAYLQVWLGQCNTH